MTNLSAPETEAILTICLTAAFADGEKHDDERRQIKELTANLAGSEIDLPALHQRVLLARPDLDEAARPLAKLASRQLAYEMAVCVCEADGQSNAAEQDFLRQLRSALNLSPAAPPPSPPAVPGLLPASANPSSQPGDTPGMILRYAILTGALELLPQTLATVAIVPLQIKMVYRIGSERGYQLDRQSAVEFMTTLGLGLGSQLFEGFARRLTKGLGKSIAGKSGGKIGDAVGGIALTFGTTYALGRLATVYYEGGRNLNPAALKAQFPALLSEGKNLAANYTAQVTEQSQQLRDADLTALLGKAP